MVGEQKPLNEEPAPHCWPMEPLNASPLQQWVRQWFVYCHGEGEPHQADAYRCMGCRRLITWHMIRRGWRCPCGAGEMRVARLRWYEKLRLLVLPWTV